MDQVRSVYAEGKTYSRQQDSFRKLLSTPAPPRDKANGKPDKSKPKAVDASKPAFQPRKVKKQSEGKYRDRASERREGKASDYTQAEALLQDFEKRTANEDKDVVEQQRRYLGGDSTHTVLVKGLDLSLLEANRAKESRNTDDDDLLEAAYRGEDVSPPLEASASPAPADEPKKRSRADIIKQMKEKRKGQAPVAAPALPPKEDKTIDKSKFKSIGFKPAGDKPKKKKAKTEGDGERKKKKRKVEGGEGKASAAEASPSAAAESAPPASASITPAPVPQPAKPKEPSPEPIPEDFDIFAGAGDYEGIPDEEDVSDREDAPARPGSAEPGEVQATASSDPNAMQGVEQTEPSVPRARWFNDDEPREPVLPPRPATPPALKALKQAKGKQRANLAAGVEDGEVQSDEETPARLAPLESSAVPSIKDLLAMDEAREALEKRQKRKEKKKKGTGGPPAAPPS